MPAWAFFTTCGHSQGVGYPTGSHVQVLLWANYSSTSSLDVSFPQRVAPSHLVLEDSRLMCLKCFSLHLLLCSGASEHRFGFFFERSGGSQLFQSVLALGARAVSPPSDSLRRIHGAPRCLRPQEVQPISWTNAHQIAHMSHNTDFPRRMIIQARSRHNWSEAQLDHRLLQLRLPRRSSISRPVHGFVKFTRHVSPSRGYDFLYYRTLWGGFQK